MALDIEGEIAALRRMTVPDLRSRYEQLHGERPRSAHKEHLVRRIVWRMQALAEGDLAERARRQAAELARNADLRLRAPRAEPGGGPLQTVASFNAINEQVAPARDPRLPPPGTLLVRTYRTQTLQVKVLERGFEYENRIYGSLTAVARQITGKHWNGYHFFGLTTEATSQI